MATNSNTDSCLKNPIDKRAWRATAYESQKRHDWATKHKCICSYESVSCSVKADSVTPWTVARQAPLSMVFSRKNYWSGLPFPSLGDLPNPGMETVSTALAVRVLIFWATRETLDIYSTSILYLHLYLSIQVQSKKQNTEILKLNYNVFNKITLSDVFKWWLD